MGAKLVSEVASKPMISLRRNNDCYRIDLSRIVREGIKNVTAGANPLYPPRIEAAAATAVEAPKETAIPVSNKDAIAQVKAVLS